MDDFQPNPIWADRVLRKHWAELEDRVGAEWMPATWREGFKRREVGRGLMRREVIPPYAEHGTGGYGCVFAVQGSEKVVIKVTSDPSEATFIVAAMQIGEWPAGVVRYHDIVQLPGLHERRPVFVVWREEAEPNTIGELGRPATEVGPDGKLRATYDNDARLAALGRLNMLQAVSVFLRARCPSYVTANAADWLRWAGLLEEAAEQSEWALGAVTLDWVESDIERAIILIHREPKRRQLAASLSCFELIMQLISTEPGCPKVGEALGFYMAEGMFLADVHRSNIGKVHRAGLGGLAWVITDPGHMVPLTPKWFAVPIDRL